jgi:hypothetical protein
MDGPRTGPDHPLGVSEDDELLALERVQLLDYPLLDRRSTVSWHQSVVQADAGDPLEVRRVVSDEC